MISNIAISNFSVAMQGYEGCFHQQAAHNFFGDNISAIPCDTFRKVVAMAETGQTNASIMAIENSIVGSILPNYTLLQKSKLKIIGEVYLHIQHQLLVNPGVKLSDIREVHSHPMALLQCMEYLEQFPQWKIIETEDTALSARHIHQRHSLHQAAIASAFAGEMYSLDIAAKNVHSIAKNYTRFWILQEQSIAQPVEDATKASIRFQTDHSKGSLANALNCIAAHNVNLSMIQSMPIPGTKFKYGFHADLEFASIVDFEEVMKALSAISDGVQIFGIYKAGINL